MPRSVSTYTANDDGSFTETYTVTNKVTVEQYAQASDQLGKLKAQLDLMTPVFAQAQANLVAKLNAKSQQIAADMQSAPAVQS